MREPLGRTTVTALGRTPRRASEGDGPVPALADGRPSPHRLGFFLFLLANAALFIKPQQLFTDLVELPLYLYIIVACLAVSLGAVLRQLRYQALVDQPITVGVLGMFLAVTLSHLQHSATYEARMVATEYAKLAAYYLLLVGLVDSPARLRRFLGCLEIYIVAVAVVALLNYHGVMEIVGVAIKDLIQSEYSEEIGDFDSLRRLVGTGFFNDPNDLALIIVTGLFLGLYLLFDRRWGFFGWFWVAPLGLLSYAFALTYSRGGFIALMAGGTVFAYARFGWKKMIPLIGLGLPVLVWLFGGRMTSIGVSENTGQERIHLWSEALVLFRGAPLFGIGVGQFQEEVLQVVHNSYLQAFAETGLFGGTLFLGCFFTAALGYVRANRRRKLIPAGELRRLLPYLFAILVGYAAGISTLTRNWATPTFMMLGLASAYLGQLRPWVPQLPRAGLRLAIWILGAAAAFLVLMKLFVQMSFFG